MVYASFVFDRETTKALSATNFSQLRWGLEGMRYATADQPVNLTVQFHLAATPSDPF